MAVHRLAIHQAAHAGGGTVLVVVASTHCHPDSEDLTAVFTVPDDVALGVLGVEVDGGFTAVGEEEREVPWNTGVPRDALLLIYFSHVRPCVCLPRRGLPAPAFDRGDDPVHRGGIAAPCDCTRSRRGRSGSTPVGR